MIEESKYIELAKYLSGECSDQEKSEIETWLEEMPDRQTLLVNLKQGWVTKSDKKHNWDVESSILRLKNRIREEDEVQIRTPHVQLNKTESKFLPMRRNAKVNSNGWLMRAAIILFLAIGMAIVFGIIHSGEFSSTSDQIAMREVVTKSGEHSTVILDDGTRVRLNVDSRLKIPNFYGENTRTIQLSGEAWFEVVPDERPFIVIAGDALVEVLGTSFNIFSYDNEPFIQLVIADGEVSFQSALSHQADRNGVVLKGGDMAIMQRNGSGKITIAHNVNVDRYIGWLNQRLVFEDTPMEQVARQLERWFGINIQFQNRELENMRFSAVFSNESLNEILSVMTLSLNMDYELKNKEVIFKSKK